MSDYNATARTNYFKVKDVAALKAELIEHGITPDSHEGARAGAEFVLDDGPGNTPSGSIALFSYSTWPSFDEDSVAQRLGIFDEETDVPQKHASLQALISSHLVEGEVAIFFEIGFEKMRYLGGVSVAINAAGETRRIDLADIYELAKELTTTEHAVTLAEY